MNFVVEFVKCDFDFVFKFWRFPKGFIELKKERIQFEAIAVLLL